MENDFGTAYGADFGSCWHWSVAPPGDGEYAFQQRVAGYARRHLDGALRQSVGQRRGGRNVRPASAPQPQRRGHRSPMRHTRGVAGYRSRTSYAPFETEEIPRGKFSAFPASVTRQLPMAPDPLGYTPYRHSPGMWCAPDEGYYLSDGCRHTICGDRGSPRGRACRFPTGGYPIGYGPAWSFISETEDAPPAWYRYADLEDQARGKGSRYPHELDPYPNYRK